MSSTLFAAYKLVKILVYPMTWIVALLFLALLSSFKKRVSRSRACLLLALLLVYGLSIQPVSRTLTWSLERFYPARTDWDAEKKPTPEMAPYNAVVILAGGVNRRGGLRPEETLSSASLGRLLYGRRLLMRGFSSTAVLSGGNANIFDANAEAEALIMKRTLESLGVGARRIETETVSRTTYESAVEMRKLLAGRSRIALVTSALHMPRAMALFRKQGFDAKAFPCDFITGPPARNYAAIVPQVEYLGASTAAINEWVGIGVYWAAGKLAFP